MSDEKEPNKFPLLAFDQVEQQEIEQGIHKKDSESEKLTLLVKKTQWWTGPTVMLVIQKLNLTRLTLFLVIFMPWIMQTMLRKRFLLLLVKCRKQSTRRLLKHLMKIIRERGTYEHITKLQAACFDMISLIGILSKNMGPCLNDTLQLV